MSLHISILHNGKQFPRPLVLPCETPVSSLFNHLLTHLSLPPNTRLRLLTQGTQLHASDTPISDTPLSSSQKLFVISTAESTISALNAVKPDPLLRPFSAPPARFIAAPQRTKRAPSAFGRIETLPGLPDREKALAILNELANDAGFARAMKIKGWTVGVLKEMKPEGKVGIDPVCVLGFNVNKGQEIHLRLRTDDLKGFRARSSIRQVLAHELAHNEVSDHNNEFKELMRWIEKIANKEDWKVGGHRLDGGGSSRLPEGREDALGGHHTGETRALAFVGRLGGGEQEDEHRSHHMDGVAAQETSPSFDEGDQTMHVTEENDEVNDGNVKMGEIEGNAEIDKGNRGKEGAVEGVKQTKMISSDAGQMDKPSQETEAKRVQDEKESAVSMLQAMGYPSVIARVALRERGGDVTRAADWLLSGGHLGRNEWDGVGGESDQGMVDAARSAVMKVRKNVQDVETVLTLLETIHMYLGNVLRGWEQQRWRRINGANEAFRRRVGNVNGGLEVMQAAGWECGDDGWWKFVGGREGGGRVWAVKEIVMEALVEEAMKS